jgi:WD40 repeat protein
LCNFLVAAGGRVLTGGQLGKVFDADTGAVLFEHRSPLNCAVAFERHGLPHVAIGSYTGEILVFALGAQGGLQPQAVLSVYDNAVKGLSCSDGLLFSVCASADVAWHRTDDLAPVRRVGRAHDRIANACCAIGPGRFASVSRDRTLRLWGLDEPETHLTPHLNSVKCIAIDDDRTTVLTGSYGGTLALFDLAHKQWSPVQRPTASGISSITWDPARRAFLAASYDGGIYAVPR